MAIVTVTNRDGKETVALQVHREGESIPEVTIAPTGSLDVELKSGETVSITTVENING